MQPDYSKLDPELQDKIKKWQANAPSNKQIQVLEDLADMSQELINLFDGQKEASAKGIKEIGATLLDIRDKLGSLDSKEAPEMPDYAKPIVKAVDDMKKALEASIKAIEVKPEVKVSTPDVKIPQAPRVDLSALEKIIKTDVPKAFQDAVKLIPKTDIPKNDYSELADLLSAQLNWLESIDIATRMKPQPGVMKVTNPDGSNIGGGTSGGAAKVTDAYGIQAISDDGTYKYFFFEADNAAYYIMRKHKTNKTFTYTAGTGGYAAIYQSSILGPSGSPTWADRGATF